MDEIKAKQKVVEKITEASKILVTVSDNPSVDALSAALGLTLLLDKQEKYASAIFSGETPPAIAFLEPEKTFDDTTDSLRDFIIALNKEKADHLRYKVEGDAVKIFITPYKTTINQDDLEFSQGDYNVELVIAIGVDSQDHLDGALDNHGQILHDAAIITMTAGDQTSDLGGIDWHDSNASSLSEMIAGIAEAMKTDKKKSLLDESIATALLTGIVAETERFSNEHTTSKVMTVAANLMAAGADQQLIATELQRSQKLEVRTVEETEPEPAYNDVKSTTEEPVDPTRLSIKHEETLAELDKRVRGDEAAEDKIEDELEAVQEAQEAAEAARAAEASEEAASQPPSEPEPAAQAPAQPEPPVEPVAPQPAPEVPRVENVVDTTDSTEPTFGGVLNATTDQAEDDARRAAEADQNRTILSHSYIGDPTPSAAPGGFPGTPPAAPGSVAVNDVNESFSDGEVHSSYAFDDEPGHAPALSPELASEPPVPSESVAVGGERVIQPLSHDEDQTPPFTPPSPEYGLPLPPPIPDFSQGLAEAIPSGAPIPPPFPDAFGVQPLAPFTPPVSEQPGILGDILAPESNDAAGLSYEATNAIAAPGTAYAAEEMPPLPPQPFTAPEQPLDQPASQPPVQPPVQPPSQAANPNQFQIPGQQ